MGDRKDDDDNDDDLRQILLELWTSQRLQIENSELFSFFFFFVVVVFFF